MTTHFRDAAVTLVPVGLASVAGIEYEVWTSPTGSRITDLRDISGSIVIKVTSSSAGELFFDDPADHLAAYLKSPTGKFYGTLSNEGRDAIPTMFAALVDATLNEKIQDVASGLITGGVLTNITATYDDPGGKLNLTVRGAPAYLGTVASQAAMLALTGQRGDYCTRTDPGSVGDWILTADTPTQLASWHRLSLSAVALADLPSGTTLTVTKPAGGSWPTPPRPTARTDIIVQWKGADPSPAIVSSGTGGMLDGVDLRLVTP